MREQQTEYRLTWGPADAREEELFEDHAEALLREQALRDQKAPGLERMEARPVGGWSQIERKTITVLRERAATRLLAKELTADDRDFIRQSLITTEQQAEGVVTLKVDAETRIVKLLYPELAEATK